MTDSAEFAPHPETLLLVDDDPMVAMVLRRLLKTASRPVYMHACADGLDALQFLFREERLPIAMLLDLEMPRMKGLECLGILRKIERFKALRVYVVTGSSATEDQLLAESLNVAGFFSKPDGISDAADMLNTILNVPTAA